MLLVVTLSPRPDDRRAQAVDSPLDLHALDGALLVAYQAAFAVAIGAFMVAAASLVVRFRRARGIERQQLRWVRNWHRRWSGWRWPPAGRFAPAPGSSVVQF
jgi:hypothetical protein